MSNRIQQLFSQHKASIAYLTAGDGGIQQTLAYASALIAGGVNMLEIGVPFSDPIADGPVIQRATMRALKSGTTLHEIIWLVKEIRKQSAIPLVLFSYLNPLLAVFPHFLHEAKQAGVDGLLLVDCPLEESALIQAECVKHALDLIYVITPMTPVSRIQKIAQTGSGFLYYACRKGTTGVRDTLPIDLQQKIAEIKTLTHLPVVVGFGISNPTMAKEVLQVADGVVVGSLFVKAIEEGMTPPQLSDLAKYIYLT